MTNPDQSITVNDDITTAAASELKSLATRGEDATRKYSEAVAAFQADSRLDGDVMPASKATLDLLTQVGSQIKSTMGEIFGGIDKAGDVLHGRVATATDTEAQNSANIGGIDTGGTPR